MINTDKTHTDLHWRRDPRNDNYYNTDLVCGIIWIRPNIWKCSRKHRSNCI